MKAVVQRVVDASVMVADEARGSIDFGLLVYLGVACGDTEADAAWLAKKIAALRIFDDANGKMNCSLQDILQQEQPRQKTGVLAVSQFTLLGDARKGCRPSWGWAAPPETAKQLYEYFMEKIQAQNLLCESGEFQAHMKVSYTNDGPVTILLDSRE